MNLRIPFPNTISSIPDILMGMAFLATWIDQGALGEGMVVSLSLVMIMEFFVIHSAGFMAGIIYGSSEPESKIKALLGLGSLYFFFVVGIAMGFQTWWPVFAFWGMMGNRMMSIFTDGSEREKKRALITKMWGNNIWCYLLSFFAAVLIPLPSFGVSGSAFSHLDMTGDFVDEPHRMMAWGFFYYVMVAYAEFRGARSQPAGGSV
jgi:hypothetical protein